MCSCFLDPESGDFGTVEVNAADGLAYEFDPRVVQYWIQTENFSERVAASLAGLEARDATVEWTQLNVANVAPAEGAEPQYRIVVTIGLREPLARGELTLALQQIGAGRFQAVRPTAWLAVPPPTLVAPVDIGDFELYRSDVLEWNGGAAAPFKFQTWIKPLGTTSYPPRLLRLNARPYLSSSFDMALLYGKIGWANVSTTGTQDFRIIVEGELHDRFPANSTGRRLNVNVWQRGGNSFTLATPTHWIDI